MNQRNQSLDALRGFAILTMILSGSIAYGDVLPAWMFHAQVPPPTHTFNPALPGITWVDLVFPFFLFSMGAAIPLSLKKHTETKEGFLPVLGIAVKRFVLLAFFALFTQHLKAWVIAVQPGVTEQWLSLLAFVLLFFQLYENKNERLRTIFLVAKIISFAIALSLLWRLPFWGGKGFDWYHSDIIIMVLANMALFGILIYYLTANKPLLRIGLLPFIMAIFLAAKEPAGGWAKEFFNFSHIGAVNIDWLYKFYFLKYLFIVIPGMFAGEWMMETIKNEEQRGKLAVAGLAPPLRMGNDGVGMVDAKPHAETVTLSVENWLAMIGFLLVVVNLYGLFTRMLLLNLVVTGLLCGIALYLTRQYAKDNLYKRLIMGGTYLLLLGLCFEAYEGGIKKDASTCSYYFVTSGLAFYALLCFAVMDKRKYFSSVTHYFSLNGKNPMVAYVAGNLLLLPLLTLTHTKALWDGMNQNAVMGLIKGLVFTGIVSLITIFFVKRRWFWKT
jgi:predicted acyltransferase